jgi:AAHS family 4-hydroxybenzoate transporter-like MFS transporter
MADASSAPVVNVGDVLNRRLSGFQTWAVAVCALSAIFDGFDIQSINILAPVISQNLHIPIGAFGVIISCGWLGVMIGSLLSGPIADHSGRRLPVIISVFVFGICTLFVAHANSFNEILVYRFLTGLGLGGVLPNLLALTSEYSPARLRGRIMLMMFSGIPVGSVVGALLGSVIVPAWGWRGFLYIGAIFPIVLGLVLLKALPESLMFLVTRGADQARVVRLMQRIAPDLACTAATRFEAAEGQQKKIPWSMLFSEGHGTTTALLWLIYFTNFLVFMFPYTWLASILRLSGLPLSLALALTSLFALGGIIGMWMNGWFIDRFGVRIPLVICYIGCFIFMGIFGLVAGTHSVPLLGVVVFITGAFINAAQGGNNVLAAGLYPTALRSTGLGLAFTVGRIGSIISPVVGGLMIAAHWHFPTMFLVAGLPAVIGAVAILAIRAARQAQPQASSARA